MHGFCQISTIIRRTDAEFAKRTENRKFLEMRYHKIDELPIVEILTKIRLGMRTFYSVFVELISRYISYL